jgi:CoA:oxalate CoA-transferase
MLDCQIAILENAIARYLSKGEIPQPMGSRHPSIAPFEAFKTKDSHIIIAAGNEKLFQGMCEVLNCDSYKQEKFKDNQSRNKNIDELKVIIESKLKDKTTEDWVSLFTEKKIPCGPIYNIKEAVENPQIEFRNMIVSANHNKIGKFKMAGNPIKMSNYEDKSTRGEIPDLDQHRDKILKEFG